MGTPHGDSSKLRGYLRVVLMSGHIGDALLERGIPPGGPTLLDKPLSYAGLLRAVRLALDEPGRGVGDTAAADAQ